ncbi:band 3 anion transport protein isoform X3 [Cimex lectularius]|uniref:Anion exchange protein n=1 Tax=Cimex lectularius TaxID=79782 RepID=A0A8I6TKP0_CIMLE|nr:band 3 anion transport protein isoform X3 [Cimex lectularius]
MSYGQYRRSYNRSISLPFHPLPTLAERDGREGEGNAELDEEMEKMFKREDQKGEEWLAHISEGDPPNHKTITEQDYNFHRKKSYPHMHAPLKALHSKRKRAHSCKGAADDPTAAMSRKSSQGGTDSDTVPTATSPTLEGDDTSIADDVPLSEEGEVSERASTRDTCISLSSPDKRVQFDIGKQVQGSPEIEEGKISSDIPVSDDVTDEAKREQDKKRRRHWRHHHHHHRKHSLVEDPGWRKRSGVEALPRRMSEAVLEETSTLQEMDQDDLVSHRFDISKGKRRFSVRPKDLQRKESIGQKKLYDHSPHEVFVQLDELCGIGAEREWKETARWIKYEEDVEEGAERWGRPHVAPLSFHSLLNLRKCLETGVILVDLEEKELPGVVYRVVEQMAIDELITENDKPIVMRALLLRHRHVQEERFRFNVRRNTASYSSLQYSHSIRENREESFDSMNLNDEHRKARLVPSASAVDTAKANFLQPPNHTAVDMKEETYMSSSEDLTRKAAKESILKRIPIGAEATTVLVGAVDFLAQPTIAFVRLAEGILIPTVTEIPIPVRFMFILLGPLSADLDYHEIGRSISTLMSNPEFHKIAYRASARKELLSAINEFLDCSIVLPPGNWERQALLPFNELKAKTEAIRRRQSKAVQLETSEQKALMDGGDEDDDDGWKKKGEDDPLRRTRRPWGGLINDIKRRFPHYKSDVKDGFNGQCLAAAIFMYFAALSGAITFGGLMADKTDNLVGISETLISTAIGGIVFALLSGQPLVIIGATGPLLLFDESLYTFCQTSEIDYLTTRVYIGIWLLIIALVVSFFEGSVLVKLFTRFTEEIFASLISLLYIVESVMKVCRVYDKHPIMTLTEYCMAANESMWMYTMPMFSGNLSSENGSNVLKNATQIPQEKLASENNLTHQIKSATDKFIPIKHHSKRQAHISWTNQNSFQDKVNNSSNSGMNQWSMNSMMTDPLHHINEPNTALFCTILALGTFFIAHYLRQFRNSKFLGRSARRALGDFGVPIAIVVMVGLDYITPGAYTEKLKVPEGLSPSAPEVRGWFIPPAGLMRPLPLWAAFAAFIPALLVYILLFMETHISELIIDKKERKLKKGSGFHLDIVLICLLNVGCGFIGAPFVCAATVRSVTHVSAVTVMSRTHAPGEKPHIIEVKEQRVSALLVSILVGLSVLMSPLLRLVPMSVLFGVFLYMGISSINGIQFFERCRLFFMPVKHHPQSAYVRRVQTLKMHLFTLIQLLCLVVLWIVKSSGISLAFPFFLILMVPLRAQLRFIFSPSELRALDSDEPDDVDGNEEDPDFYTEALLPG